MEEKNDIWDNAWSFEGSAPPKNADLIEVVHRYGQDWFFYKDEDGNYWYQSESQMKYELEAEAQARARKREAMNKKRR